jgi:hypothetical protein
MANGKWDGNGTTTRHQQSKNAESHVTLRSVAFDRHGPACRHGDYHQDHGGVSMAEISYGSRFVDGPETLL